MVDDNPHLTIRLPVEPPADTTMRAPPVPTTAQPRRVFCADCRADCYYHSDTSLHYAGWVSIGTTRVHRRNMERWIDTTWSYLCPECDRIRQDRERPR